MVRTDNPKIAFVEGCDHCLIESFSDSDDGGISGAEAEVAVAVDEFSDPFPISDGKSLYDKLAIAYGLVDNCFSSDAELAADRQPVSAITKGVVTSGPLWASRTVLTARWSGSRSFATATRGPVSTISTVDAEAALYEEFLGMCAAPLNLD